MTEFLSEHWKYLIGAVFVHLLIAGVVALAALNTSPRTVVPMLAIQAVVVDKSVLEAPGRRERERQARAAAERRKQDEQRQQETERQQREAEEQAQREAEQQKQKQQEQLQREQQQREVEQRKREQDQAAERTRQAEADRARRQAAEKERIEAIQRKQREAEERRRADAERQAQAARESELQRQLEEEEGRSQAVNAGLLNQYAALLEQRIMRNWNRPPTARPGIECTVRVTQTTNGTVLTAQVTQCNGDGAVRQSIEAAVLRASPLPLPPDPRLFERTLDVRFKPAE